MAVNPYPEPGPITDRNLLRGRDGDAAVVRSHLTTRRWTVLHGRSGAGKSRLLAAGIKSVLEQKDRYKVVILDCGKVAPPLFDALALAGGWAARGFNKVREQIADEHSPKQDRKLLLILDQFEQYLNIPNKDDSDEFLECLVVRNDWFVNVCVGIREDELSRLSRLRTSRFNPFDNLIALRDLSEDEAREIIVGPLSGEGERIGFTDGNIGRIIESLKEPPEGRILAAVLAIFCYDAWEIVSKGGQPLRDIDEDLRSAIRGYCQRALNDLCNGRASYERAAVKMLDLLSAGRLRRRVSREELRKTADETTLGEILKDLVDRWLVERTDRGGGDDSYAIVHDRFVGPIEEWVRERPTPPEDEKPDSERDEREKRISLLEALSRLAGLGVAVAWAECSEEEARDGLLKLWPEIRNSLDVTAKTVLRWMAIRFEVSSLPPGVCRESGGDTLSLDKDGWVELRRPREGPSRLRTEGEAVGYSFSADGECVVAHDKRGFLYVWDLAGFLQIKVSFTPAGFASAILSPEDIYRHLVREIEPETILATSTEDLVYTFQELTGE